jgi:GxxExxY protein
VHRLMSEQTSESPSGDRQPFAQIGYDFMAACFEVHNVLGGGLSEEIYQESLEWKLSLRNIRFVSKRQLHVFYKGHPLETRYVPDLVVFDHIVVELKSLKELAPDHERQLFNYLRITRQPVGYLVNFAPMDKVHWKRFLLSEYLPKNLDG